MATLDKVVIKITGDTKGVDSTLKKLQELGKVDKQNAASFKQTSKEQGKALDFVKGKGITLGVTLLGAFAIQAVVGDAIRTLKKFEKELSTLQSITGSTVEEMEFFSKAAITVGRATKTSATEVVKAFTLIGSAQPELLKNSEALAEVTKQALILSQAAGIDATQAATALTSAMNQFGAEAKDAAKFTDIFATSQQKGSSFIADTSEALINAGAAASAAGLSFETTNAA
ncbi:MAG: phage tail tape measure protein, partial [Nitrosopumilus sp.]